LESSVSSVRASLLAASAPPATTTASDVVEVDRELMWMLMLLPIGVVPFDVPLAIEVPTASASTSGASSNDDKWGNLKVVSKKDDDKWGNLKAVSKKSDDQYGNLKSIGKNANAGASYSSSGATTVGRGGAKDDKGEKLIEWKEASAYSDGTAVQGAGGRAYFTVLYNTFIFYPYTFPSPNL
jgi:hypothetical protein